MNFNWPVLNHPSVSNDWDVTWGKFKYPRNTPGPYEVENEKEKKKCGEKIANKYGE